MARKSTGKTAETGAKRSRSTSKTETLRREPSRGEATVGARSTKRSAGRKAGTVALAHDQIADRARAIWERRGCPQGEDDRIWREAEDELKREIGVGR
jgi:hypothetical protein